MKLRIVTSLLVMAMAPASCLAGDKLAPELKGQQGNGAVDVIVQY